jgi:ATP-dependent DNA helicase RecG
MNIFVKMFDNHLTVESPGSFPPPVTAETVYDHHNPRNPHLMNALFYLDYAKQANEGTTRMRTYMKEANLPEPEFYQKEIGFHQVHVVLRNAIEARKEFVDAGAMKLIGEQVFDSLTPDEKQVINFVAEHGRINVSDANRILNRDWHTAKGVLEGLMARQILHRHAKSAKPRSMAFYLLRRVGK